MYNQNQTAMPKFKTIEEAIKRFIDFYKIPKKANIEVNPQPEGHVYLTCTHKGVKYGQCYMIEN